jgi:hypothetical protein
MNFTATNTEIKVADNQLIIGMDFCAPELQCTVANKPTNGHIDYYDHV